MLKKRITALTIIMLFILSAAVFASPDTTTLASVTAVHLNVRTGPGISHPRITQIARDTVWFVLEQQSGWVRIVLTDGSTGWVSGNFVALRSVPARLARVTAPGLNVRTGPGLSFSRIAIAFNGAVLPVLVEQNGWVQVQLPSGRYGWISAAFVSFGNVSAPTAPPPAQPEPPPQPEPPSPPSPGHQLSQFELSVVQLVNAERERHGVAPLQTDITLSEVARLKSRDMHDNRYFSHTSPVYGSPFDMMRSFGITYHIAGENIAAGQTTPEAVVRAWMNSPGHRSNILSPRYTHIGVGYFNGPNNHRHYWTQMFVGR